MLRSLKSCLKDKCFILFLMEMRSLKITRKISSQTLQGLLCTEGCKLFFQPWRSNFFFFFFFFFLFWAPPAAYGSFQLGVESELHLPAYTMATATANPSHIFYLHCSLRQRQILNALSKARGRIHILLDTRQVHNPLSHKRNSGVSLF